MKSAFRKISTAASFALAFAASSASFAVTVKSGDLAPDFELKGHDGKTHKLSHYKGKTIVLEWFNEGCPYVKKHYDKPKQNMQSLQKKFTSESGVVWLTIASSAPGQQGYIDEKAAPQIVSAHGMNASALLLDPDGKVGKLYDAKVTPHMYVINPEGRLVYQGAIDDQPSARPDSLEKAKPLFANALTASLTKQKIAEDTTQAYGCSVKYK